MSRKTKLSRGTKATPKPKTAQEQAMDETERIRARRRAARNKLVGGR
jgi:hypothetical protein